MQAIDNIHAIADRFDAIVFDQWGVLHNGNTPYPHAVATIRDLQVRGVRMAVLSNSGKRADVNRDRITTIGFPDTAFEQIMTSGEALWLDMRQGAFADITSLHPITAAQGDAEKWRGDLDLHFTDGPGADAVLLMGLPDDADHTATRALLDRARSGGKTLLCSNPDRSSPRAGGKTVVSPGSLAHDYADAGGRVIFYGKPHQPVFAALARAMNLTDPSRILMVGDSPEHDIAGASAAGWKSLFIQAGLHAAHDGPLEDLFGNAPAPDFTLSELR